MKALAPERPFSLGTFAASMVFLVACAGSVGDVDPSSPGGPGAGPGGGAPSAPRSPGSAGAGGGDAPGPMGGGQEAPPSAADLAPQRIRRLTPAEIRNSMADILKLGDGFAAPFPDEYFPHQFDNRFDNLSVSVDFLQALGEAAERAAATATRDLAGLLSCDVARTEAACVREFVDLYGRRVFRRPLAEAERQRFSAVFTAARKTEGVAPALGAVLEALFQSPDFLFRTEYGAADAKGASVRLTGHEAAAALSYLLWRSSPDDELLAAAAGGRLDAPDGLAAQARRLLADGRASRGLRDFFLQFLELTAPNALTKGNAPPELVDAMRAEAARVFQEAVASPGRRLSDLLTSPATFVNASLAKAYGIPAPAGGATSLAPVSLDPRRRAGFLTHAGFLTAHLRENFSPIFVGLFVRRRLLCQELPMPPADIPELPKDPNATTRERFAMHSASGACKTCHTLMDPVGFTFERYGILGAYRESETAGGRTIPLTGVGELTGTDVDGPVTGPVELSSRLAGSALVADCFAAHALEFALGRALGAPEARTAVDRAAVRLVADAGGDGLDAMFVRMVGSNAFSMRARAQ